jgi:hypothetical protein
MDTEQTPEELAVNFLSNFIEGDLEEIERLTITHALSDLICHLVQQTVTVLYEEERTIH